MILITGFFFFGAGTYASVQSIINSCQSCLREITSVLMADSSPFTSVSADHAGNVKSPFTRANTGFILDH